MSEEERFLEALRTSPGDDALRLVYADWLDEQGGPRSAYLRAEVETFGLPRSGRKFGPAVKKLRRLSEKLDRLWVAQVSRPPAGVCCDRVAFVGKASALSGPELDLLEQRLALKLPVEYRAFLMTHNGGSPVPGTAVEGGGRKLFVEQLYCAPKKAEELGGRGNDLEESARGFWSMNPGFPDEDMNNETIELARTLLPVGVANGLILFLVHKGRRAGSVGICDVGDFELHEMRILARSFSSFLGMLTGAA